MKFLALYRDLGPSADGHSHQLGIFTSESDARDVILHDVRRYCKNFASNDLSVENDESMLMVHFGVDERLCEWELIRLDF